MLTKLKWFGTSRGNRMVEMNVVLVYDERCSVISSTRRASDEIPLGGFIDTF